MTAFTDQYSLPNILMQVFCICIINDCSRPISCIPYIVYPKISKFQIFQIFFKILKKNLILHRISKLKKNNSKFFKFSQKIQNFHKIRVLSKAWLTSLFYWLLKTVIINGRTPRYQAYV
jgi:hypothetical protein